MEQYIQKSALVAEIESKKKYAQTLGNNAINGSMQQFYDGMKQGCVDILSFLDTLEVKDIPSWKRATEDILIGCLVWDEQRHFHLYSDRVAKGELYISIADILRLPGSPRKE